MSSDNFLDKNAMSLSALRDLCIAYDIENNVHRPVGWDMFRFIAGHMLKGVASTKDILEVTDIVQWIKDQESFVVPPVFNHGTVKVIVTPVNEGIIDVEATTIQQSAIHFEGQLQMLREGADPKDESAWMPVCAMSDVTVAVDQASDQSITGAVGITVENETLTQWITEEYFAPESEES